jgi:hypothetical protein
MRTADLRAELEDLGATFTLERGRLVIDPPLAGIPIELEESVDRHRHALTCHVALFPRAGTGRLPLSAKLSGATARGRR